MESVAEGGRFGGWAIYVKDGVHTGDPVLSDAIRDRLDHVAIKFEIKGESYRAVLARAAEQAYRNGGGPIMTGTQITEAHIRAKVRMVAADETFFGVLSTGERIAVAVVLDRYDLTQRAWGTIAEAIYRLGPVWTEAALRVQRNGWQEDSTIP